MRFCFFLILALSLHGCMVTETLELAEDGSGTLTIDAVRHENSFRVLQPDSYLTEEVFNDTTFVFSDVIKNNSAVFERLSVSEKKVYQKYEYATLREKQNSFEKDFRRIYFSSFKKVEELPDLYKTYEYVDNIRNNYALSAERHDNDVTYFYDGKFFRRKAFVTNDAFHDEKLKEVADYRARFDGLSIVMRYTLLYRFPKQIKSVSNKNAIVGSNGRTVTIVFDILDATERPESTSFEVEFY